MMNRMFVASGVFAFVLLSGLSLPMDSQAKGFFGFHKGKICSGKLKKEVATHAASHFTILGGDNRNAGTEVSAKGRVSCLGFKKVTVKVSSSWDWGLYRSVENADVEEMHPCALVNTTPHTFSAANDPLGGGFTTTNTVVITKKVYGQTIWTIEGQIRGGSVCEIENIGVGQTVNEGMTAFKIIGGTGRYGNASGSGLLHSVVDFSNGKFLIDEIILDVKR